MSKHSGCSCVLHKYPFNACVNLIRAAFAGQMVMMWGMGANNGIRSISEEDLANLAPETLREIDDEVRSITDR